MVARKQPTEQRTPGIMLFAACIFCLLMSHFHARPCLGVCGCIIAVFVQAGMTCAACMMQLTTGQTDVSAMMSTAKHTGDAACADKTVHDKHLPVQH